MPYYIGNLIIYKKFPMEAKNVLTYYRDNKKFLFDAERKVFWFIHAKVGGELLVVGDSPM